MSVAAEPLKSSSSLAPEARLLLAAVRERDPEARVAAVQAILTENIDWDFVRELTERNQVVGLVFQALSAAEVDTVPRDLLSRLRTVHLETTQHALLLQGQLVHVLKALSERGIRALPFKGPTLGLSLYGNIALRQTWDLDILFHKEDVLEAKGVLQGLGYVFEDGTTDSDVPDRLQNDCELNFVHPNTGVVVEVHWDILPKAHGPAGHGAFLWDGAEEMDLNGARILTPKPAAVLKALLVHGGVKHMWDEVRIITDVARALETVSEAELDTLLDDMKARHVLHNALTGLLLASRLIGASLPESVERAIRANGLAGSVSALAMGRMFGRRLGLPSFEQWCAYSRDLGLLDEGSKGSAIQYWRGVMVPEFNDREALPAIPTFLAPVFYFVRAIRLASKPGAMNLRGQLP